MAILIPKKPCGIFNVRFSIKTTKPETRIEYWKYHSAALSFEQARKVAEQLLLMRNTDPMFYPLMVSMHVFYASPFKHPKKSRQIDENSIPDEFSSTHDVLIKLRDRMYAHNDKESKVKDSESNVDLFQLVLYVVDRQMKPAAQLIFHSHNHLKKIYKLCDMLYVNCMNKAEEYLLNWIDEVPDEGVYRITTDFESRTPLLIKSELSHEQSHMHLKETQRREQDQ